jgi:hypothetical protein
MKAKRMTATQKYEALKRQTEEAGMIVSEQDGKIVVTKKAKRQSTPKPKGKSAK